MKKELLDLDKEIVLSCAFRYALGRMTYVVSSVTSELKLNYYKLSDNTKELIVKEIQEYQDKHGLAGMDFDDKEWTLVKWLFDNNRIVNIEANLFNTDKWEKHEAIKGDDGKYYSIPEMKEFNKVREI